GQHRGGDGLIRVIEAREPLRVSILSERRARGAFGLEGGARGAPGSNRVIRSDGTEDRLGGKADVRLAVGDAIAIETPGGGGYGPPESVT
ncbi:MAG: hydantoinase B/oxoprolinase family protein, partial [Polyangiaceae bacterium]